MSVHNLPTQSIVNVDCHKEHGGNEHRMEKEAQSCVFVR